jgi:hypothetical protein
MAIRNNDDVAHLLQATGGTGSSYREFEGASDQMSAPLIDAVFSRDRPEAGPEGHPPGIDPSREGNLLAEVFDRPWGGEPAAGGSSWRDEAAGLAPGTPGLRQPVPGPSTSRRSLDDIRRVITRPVAQAVEASPSEGLTGLFDRLAG